MKNIFRRATVKQTDASIVQPHFIELDERDLQQVSGGRGCTPPPPRRPLPPQKHRQLLPVEPLQPNPVR